MLCFSIPCKYANKMLTVKALKLAGVGDTEELALHSAIQHTALYDSLELSTIETYTDKNNRTHMAIIAPYNETLLKQLIRTEPCTEDKLKYKGLIAQASNEEVLKYGN